MAIRDTPISIESSIERKLRALFQTVYRGMRSTDTRGDSVARLLQTGFPLLEEILTGEKITISTPLNDTPPQESTKEIV